jgi:hypothetical protein
MRKRAVVPMLLMCAAAMAFARGSDKVTLNGYVVDQHCAKGMAVKTNAMEKAASHSKDCLLMEECSASGYGIFSSGKYYPFDEKGSTTAKALIEKSKLTKAMYFEATGTLNNGTLTLASLKDAIPEKPTATAGEKSHHKTHK